MDDNKTSLVKQRKKSFAELVRLFFIMNVSNLTSVDVTEDFNLNINGTTFKLDVSDYTGSNNEPYIFFNPSNGRIVIENKGKTKVYKVEVELYDE